MTDDQTLSAGFPLIRIQHHGFLMNGYRRSVQMWLSWTQPPLFFFFLRDLIFCSIVTLNQSVQ